MKECKLSDKLKAEKAIKMVFGTHIPNNKVLIHVGFTVNAPKHWPICRRRELKIGW